MMQATKLFKVSLIKAMAKKLALLIGIVVALTFFINLPLFDETLVPELEALANPPALDITHEG